MGCLPGLGCLLLGSLWRLMLWFLRNVARNSPTCISNVEIAPLELQRFWGAAQSSGIRIACEFWLMRLPRRAPVFGRRPTTLSTIPGTLRTPPPHPTMRRAGLPARKLRAGAFRCAGRIAGLGHERGWEPSRIPTPGAQACAARQLELFMKFHAMTSMAPTGLLVVAMSRSSLPRPRCWSPRSRSSR